MRLPRDEFNPSIPPASRAGDHAPATCHRLFPITLVHPGVPANDRPPVTTDRPLVIEINSTVNRKRFGPPRGTLARIIKDPPGRQRPLLIKLEQQIPVRNRVIVRQDRETGHGNHATIYAGDGTTFAHLIS